MHAGLRHLHATFWLLEAPDSLARQSRRNPDGYGIGAFTEAGTPEIDKEPVAAYEDHRFARDAREKRSRTFVAHVRYASTGANEPQNTHPFEQRAREFAHNGVVQDLEALEQQLGDALALVRGDTDSERFFALITKETEAAGGDVGAGIAAAVRWIAANLPLYSLNFVLTSESELWALRYPDSHDLLVLERGSGRGQVDATSPSGRLRLRAGDLADRAAVIVASERLDDDDGWRSLQPGELIHVGADLRVESRIIVDGPPAHLVDLDSADSQAASSQRAG